MGYELGILIVHGIGRHRQGDTLVRWGDAFGRWLEDWTRRCDPALAVQFTSARLHPADPEPAHGVLEIAGEEGSTQWLLATGTGFAEYIAGSLALGGGALYIAAAAIWGIWDRAAIHRLFLRETATERPWQLHVLAAFWGLVTIFAFRGEDWLSDFADQGWSWSDQAWSMLWLVWTLVFWTWPVLWLVSRTGAYHRVTERAVRDHPDQESSPGATSYSPSDHR